MFKVTQLVDGGSRVSSYSVSIQEPLLITILYCPEHMSGALGAKSKLAQLVMEAM